MDTRFGLKLICGIFSIGILLTAHPGVAQEKREHRAGGMEGRRAEAIPKQNRKSEFPAYQKQAPRRSSEQMNHKANAPKNFQRTAVPVRPDSMGNRVTQDHLNRVTFAHDRVENHMRPDSHVNSVVSVGRAHYVNFYRPTFEQRTVVFNGYVNHYNGFMIGHPGYWGPWHSHSFYGGFYWGFHPVVDIDAYFYNPMVYWFYAAKLDDSYNRNWYKAEYNAYPELQRPFEYHGLYYPTENLRQLLLGVSAMPVEKQARFRTAIQTFTKKLAQQMANGLGRHVKLSNGDIAVTHYEIIGYDDAAVMEGIVNFEGKSFDFKGFVDLEKPEKTLAFVPASENSSPTGNETTQLDAMNDRIAVIKGMPAQNDVAAEPESSPAVTPPVAAEVSADPEQRH